MKTYLDQNYDGEILVFHYAPASNIINDEYGEKSKIFVNEALEEADFQIYN